LEILNPAPGSDQHFSLRFSLHTVDIQRRRDPSHSSYDGESVGERLMRFGPDRRIHGENLAGGTSIFAKPHSTFRRWMNSPAHKSNILDSRFRPVGVGTYTGNFKGIEGYTMYTVDFGVRR
jgi:uncharacterized protein YkwD